MPCTCEQGQRIHLTTSSWTIRSIVRGRMSGNGFGLISAAPTFTAPTAPAILGRCFFKTGMLRPRVTACLFSKFFTLQHLSYLFYAHECPSTGTVPSVR